MKVVAVRKWREEVRERIEMTAAWNPGDAEEAVEDRTLTLMVTDYGGVLTTGGAFLPNKRRHDVEITFTLDELRALRDELATMDLD